MFRKLDPDSELGKQVSAFISKNKEGEHMSNYGMRLAMMDVSDTKKIGKSRKALYVRGQAVFSRTLIMTTKPEYADCSSDKEAVENAIELLKKHYGSDFELTELP